MLPFYFGSIMVNVTLNLFTNLTKQIRNKKTIKEAYDSFCNVFGEPKHLNIFFDPHPNTNRHDLDEYMTYLSENFNTKITITNSLYTGWIKSFEMSNTEYMFQLEHDWKLLDNQITQSLDDLMKIMHNNNLFYMAFQRTAGQFNFDLLGDARQHVLAPISLCEYDGVKFRKLTGLSNAPQLLNKKLYMEKALPRVVNNVENVITIKGSGIEQNLALLNEDGAVLYGPYGSTGQIVDLDGRGDDQKGYDWWTLK